MKADQKPEDPWHEARLSKAGDSPLSNPVKYCLT
jgi:hypothetical protein